LSIPRLKKKSWRLLANGETKISLPFYFLVATQAYAILGIKTIIFSVGLTEYCLTIEFLVVIKAKRSLMLMSRNFYQGFLFVL